MMKSTTHKPMKMDRETKTERSSCFLTANIPVIKAMMLAGNATPTVTSHQRLSKESIFSISTSTTEAAITIKKKAFSPTDHFPALVFGILTIHFLS